MRRLLLALLCALLAACAGDMERDASIDPTPISPRTTDVVTPTTDEEPPPTGDEQETEEPPPPTTLTADTAADPPPTAVDAEPPDPCSPVDGVPRVERLGFAPGYTFISADVERVERELDGMAAAGVCWVRIDIDWSRIQPTAEEFVWEPTDRAVFGARDRGMQVLGLIGYTPRWARPEGTSDKHPPSDFADFAEFAAEVTRRYQPAGVHTWEIWNEPNIDVFWQPAPDPVEYVRLLRAGAQAIREQDPSAFIVTAGLSPAADDGTDIAPLTFLDAMYQGGAAGAFDAVGFHPYSYPSSPVEDEPLNHFVTVTPELRQLMEAHGDGSTPIWATEYGAPTGTNDRAVSRDDQARHLSDAIDQWNEWEWTGPLFIYSWRDRGTDPADREQNFGLVDHKDEPKPALHALLAITGGTPPH
jgi:hypothetical protein